MDRAATMLLLLLGLAGLGCASRSRPPRSSADSELWRQGYGFNNPNVERARQGLPPLNFDGTVHGEEKKDPWWADLLFNVRVRRSDDSAEEKPAAKPFGKFNVSF
jgi:hypothetical protein